jgi:hypothetical protein
VLSRNRSSSSGSKTTRWMMTLTWQLCCWASLVAWVALLQQMMTIT